MIHMTSYEVDHVIEHVQVGSMSSRLLRQAQNGL